MMRSTIRFVGRRLLLIAPLILAAMTITFLLMRVMPGDPAELIAGPDGSRETIAAIRHSLDLDRPIVVQYGFYLAKLAEGDLGTSTMTGRPVIDEIRQRLPITIILTGGAMTFAVAIGPMLGMLAAFRRNTTLDFMLSAAAVAGVSIPSFWLGLMLIFVFAGQLRWLPSMGVGGFANWILPCITLGVGPLGLLARMTRATMLDVMGESYIWTARSKGVPEYLIVARHGLRNTLVPLVTIIGTEVGYMLGGAMVTETVFSLPGFGRLIVDAVLSKDYAVVQAGILVTSGLVILVNLMVDLSYFVLDPRIRGRAGGS